ncbi:hypothetical protein CLAFUR0_02670 [Fulvia fulva]|nr:hypothetical protein CLAFUR0_02670 [Fulvia fulva]
MLLEETTMEERAEQDYCQRTRELQTAQDRFDNRLAVHNQEAAQFHTRLRRGQTLDDKILEFDMRHYQRGQQLTRELIEAEERFAVAKQNAIRLGVRTEGDDRTSGFLDDQEDGLVIDQRPPKDRVNQGRIHAWLNALPGKFGTSAISLGPEAWPEVDDWDAGMELGSSDSASVVAGGSRRRRIQSYRAAMDRVKDATNAP